MPKARRANNLRRHTALVTGGSRGIGFAIANELAAAGFNLFLVARHAAGLRRAARDITQRHGVDVACRATNIADVKDVESLVRDLRRRRTTFRVVVHDAGVFIEGTLGGASIKAFTKTMDTNLLGMFVLMQGLLPLLPKRMNPRVVIIGSTAGIESYLTGSVYGVSKFATRGYAINLRQELMHRGIGVTLITPGGTLTDLWADDVLPPNRLMPPEDIARLVRLAVDLAPQTVVEEIVVRPLLGDIHE